MPLVPLLLALFPTALLTKAAVSTSAAQAPALRVACLGDSLTYGALVADREHNAYPAQLGRLLAHGAHARYEVRNFGVGGRTLLRAGDTPYVATDAYRAALAWKPDVAVVVLGTNDTVAGARHNWEHAGDLERDARALVAELRDANPAARVLLCAPPAMFPDQPGLADGRRADLLERAPRLTRVAAALRAVALDTEGAEFHDLSRVLRPGDTVDGVHTSPFGAERMADFVAQAVDRAPAEHAHDDVPRGLARRGIEATAGEWSGYRRLDFALPGCGAACTLVAPDVPLAGRPWIWRARFFGHEPDLDLDLLERGFHLAYCDVADLYGAPAAVARWDELYALVVGELGFHARPVVEGMSRGGLPTLQWAIAGGTAAALVLDNPVCDVRSWPGGRTGKRSDDDWERCRAAYGLTEEQVWAFDGGPLERLAPLAARGVPLLVVLGLADEVVPVAENGSVLVARYRALGGPVDLWEKPGIGHHPHGLHPVAPLRRAVLAACGLPANPAVRAVPSVEYRGPAAGWGEHTWWDELEALRAAARAHEDVPLVFLGDSITQGLSGAADRVAHADGARAFDRYHGARGALSLGLSGDRTEHLLYRIEHGALALVDPRVIVLQIGVNNVNAAGHTARETAAGIAAVVRLLRAREPQAHVVVCGPFPAGFPREPRRTATDEVHALVAGLDDDPAVTVLDLRPLFLEADGRPNARMGADGIHVSSAGYEAWMEALEPTLAQLLRN